MKVVKHCNRTCAKYLSGPVHRKLNLIKKKCSVMKFGKSKRRHRDGYSIGMENINKKKEEKDLGVIIMDNMSPEKRINEITDETHNLLMNIRVAFT